MARLLRNPAQSVGAMHNNNFVIIAPLSLYDLYSAGLSRLADRLFSVDISENHKTLTYIIIGNAPFFHKRPTFFAVKSLFAPGDDAGRDPQLRSLKHHIFCHAESICRLKQEISVIYK